MKEIKLQIIAPCYYPSLDVPHLKYLWRSGRTHRIPVYHYGVGQQFKSWLQTHITDCLDVLKGNDDEQTVYEDTTHILFTDASDVAFVRPRGEIEQRYLQLGRPPMLVSAEWNGLNAGGWIGEREVAIAILEHLAEPRYTSGDPQERWREAVNSGRIRVALDLGMHIFQVMTGGENKLRDTCLVHFAGGYTDPVAGKAEQIEPYWKQLGYGDADR